MKNLIVFSFLCMLAILPVKAEGTPYYFDTSNELGAWTGDQTSGFGWVDVEKKDDGYVHFTLNANTDFFTSQESGLAWDKFYFNYLGGYTIDQSIIKVVNATKYETSIGNDDKNGTQIQINVSEFGDFDYGTSIQKDKLNPLEVYIEDKNLNVSDFLVFNSDGYLFAGHLKNFTLMENINGKSVDSTFLGVGDTPAPVPEPGTLLLLGSGLAGLAAYRRRR